MSRTILVTEPTTGLSVAAALLDAQAPANATFLWEHLHQQRNVAAIHAMWTGPEFSCPIPVESISPVSRDTPLPLENATIMPQPGDLVLTWLAPRVWGGGPAPIFDLGLFYGPGARLLFPIGWQPGSIVARIASTDLAELAAACSKLRQTGSCSIGFARAAV